MALRWKKKPARTGLARIGAPPAGSELTDGTKRYAWTSPAQGRGGWFWVSPSDATGELINTCAAPVATEAEAKAAAMAWVRERLGLPAPAGKKVAA